MKLDPPEEHGLVYVLRSDSSPVFPEGYVRAEEIRGAIEAYILKNISEFQAENFLVYEEITEELFRLMVESSTVTSRETPLSGTYYKFDQTTFAGFRKEYLRSNDIAKLAGQIGPRYFPDTFTALEQAVLDGRTFPDAANVDARGGAEPLFDYFTSDERKDHFVAQTATSLSEVETSNLSNSDKAQARGYLLAARALAETPDPPLDVIWTILNRASNIAGIASFFISLIALLLP